MRILYLLVDETSPSHERVARRMLEGQAAMPQGWSFAVKSVSIGPPFYEENALGHAMAVPGIVHAVLTYQHAYDALLIGCFGDPGLVAARAVATIPIVGPAEASFGLVGLTARSFGLLILSGTELPDIEAYVARSGARFVGLESVDVSIGGVFEDLSRTAAMLMAAGKRLRERGAEALILGCMSFGFGPFARALRDGLDIGVIDPLRASVAALQAVEALEVRLGPSPPRIERPDALKEFLSRLEGTVPVS